MNQPQKTNSLRKLGRGRLPPCLLASQLWDLGLPSLWRASLIAFALSLVLPLSVASPFAPIAPRTQNSDGSGLMSYKDCKKKTDDKPMNWRTFNQL